MRRAIFLDRDGVINRKPDGGQYVTRWEEMHFLPEVPKAIALLNRAGFRIIIVSNQRCVAKGLVTPRGLEALHDTMCDALEDAGAHIDAVYYCPHELQPRCSCRKPEPGLLVEAARSHHVNLAASWMIGDSNSDVEAGRRAGCKTARLVTDAEVPDCNSDVVALSLLDAARQILQRKEVADFVVASR